MPTEEDTRRTLATFSNYECIRHGTFSLVGLDYCTEFTSQVFSKKERHKIGERARRNQLAVALHELERTVEQTPSCAAFQSRTRTKAEIVIAAIALIKVLRGKANELEEQCRQEETCQGKEH